MKFLEFVTFFQKIENESSRIEMTKILAQLLQNSSSADAKIIAYLSQGSLFPAYKNIQFNFAQKGMLSILAMLSGFSESVILHDFKSMGDIGIVAQNRLMTVDYGLSLQQVYDELVEIASIFATGSIEKKSDRFIILLNKVDPVGAKFIIRIVMKTLRLGFSDMTFIDALSWMEQSNKSLSKEIEAAYNVCADLGLVAYTLKQNGIRGIREMSISVGIPIRPAAAERMTSPADVVAKLGRCVAQPKLDGFRVQVHLKKSISGCAEVHFFSRNMLDMSDMFPDLKALVAALPVRSLICEGEAIVYDEDSESFLPFQQTVKRKRKHDVEQMSIDMPLRLYLFDVLYLNGESLLNNTHVQRRILLQEIVEKTNSQALQVIEEKIIMTARELQDYFLLNITAGLEGLVVKREDAIYQPGKRNFNWIKLKREAHGSLIDTVDCVILGYYAGRGKRAKLGIGALLVGIFNDIKDEYETVAKVGTGLTDSEWKEIKKRCDSIKQLEKPKNVACIKDLYPDEWVAPEIVCCVRSDEITLSPAHMAGKVDGHPGYALRFPRFISYRPDKSARDSTTIAELLHLYAQQKIIS